MIWFAGAAVVGLAGFVRWRAGGSRRFWLAVIVSIAAFSASLMLRTGPSVWFLLLFFLPTLIVGIAAAAHRVTPFVFGAFALSDVALAAALTLYQTKTASWGLPPPGSWGAAASLAGAAALLRLAAPMVASDRQKEAFVKENFAGARLRSMESVLRGLLRKAPAEEWDLPPIDGVFTLIGWFQGAFLAWWVGGSGAALLGAGGALMCLAGAVAVRASLPALGTAGGVVAIIAAAELGYGPILAAALAGVAYVLGERMISVWILSLGPLSSIGWAAGAPTVLTDWVAAIAAPLVLTALVVTFVRVKPALPGGRLVGNVAAIGTIWAAWRIAGPWAWILYAAALSGLATALLVKPAPAPAATETEPEAGEPQLERAFGMSGVFLVPGAAIFLAAVAIAGRLLLKGLETGFL